MRVILISIILFACTLNSNAVVRANIVIPVHVTDLESELLNLSIDNAQVFEPRFKKLKAILLAVFLGHFGVHRIYLGTSPNVPVVYSLTLGGGFGLLPLLDIAAILTTKNLEKFYHNDKVFMWSKAKE